LHSEKYFLIVPTYSIGMTMPKSGNLQYTAEADKPLAKDVALETKIKLCNTL
jgi:hypothetical protein